jgi:hypothetical protein
MALLHLKAGNSAGVVFVSLFTKTGTMEKKPQIPENQDQETAKANEGPLEKEVDVDSKIHETSPNLIQKEDHHLPVDDEVKNG